MNMLFIIEPHEEMRRKVQQALADARGLEYNVFSLTGESEATDVFKTLENMGGAIAAAFVAFGGAEERGGALAQSIKVAFPHIKVVLMSTDRGAALVAQRLHLDGFIAKEDFFSKEKVEELLKSLDL